jgi:hypothetical protein
MVDTKNLMCSSKFELARKEITWEFMENLDKRLHKISPVLSYPLRFILIL